LGHKMVRTFLNLFLPA